MKALDKYTKCAKNEIMTQVNVNDNFFCKFNVTIPNNEVHLIK